MTGGCMIETPDGVAVLRKMNSMEMHARHLRWLRRTRYCSPIDHSVRGAIRFLACWRIADGFLRCRPEPSDLQMDQGGTLENHRVQLFDFVCVWGKLTPVILVARTAASHDSSVDGEGVRHNRNQEKYPFDSLNRAAVNRTTATQVQKDLSFNDDPRRSTIPASIELLATCAAKTDHHLATRQSTSSSWR